MPQHCPRVHVAHCNSRLTRLDSMSYEMTTQSKLIRRKCKTGLFLTTSSPPFFAASLTSHFHDAGPLAIAPKQRCICTVIEVGCCSHTHRFAVNNCQVYFRLRIWSNRSTQFQHILCRLCRSVLSFSFFVHQLRGREAELNLDDGRPTRTTAYTCMRRTNREDDPI